VNVAARLEGLAEPGGICVSRVVRDQVRDKLDFSFEDMGEQSVKNIARPVRVYALRPGATSAITVLTAGSTPQAAAAPRLSIVVLPFNQVHQILLVRGRDDARRHTGLIVDRLEAGGSAHRRHLRRVRTSGIALVQDGAIGQHRNAQLVAFDDCRLARLSQVAPSAYDLDALAAQQLDSIEQRGRPNPLRGCPPSRRR
jgi:hypothetical protein